MTYLLFLKKRQIFNCRLLQIKGGALRVKIFFMFFVSSVAELKLGGNLGEIVTLIWLISPYFHVSFNV